MKKLLALCLVLAMTFSLTACELLQSGPRGEELYISVLNAFIAGDNETLKDQLDSDSTYLKIIDAMETGHETAEVWQLAQTEILAKMTYSISETNEASMDDFILKEITVNVPSAKPAVQQATYEALMADVLNGGETVTDAKAWLIQGIKNAEMETVVAPLSMHEGNIVVDDNDLLIDISADFYSYDDVTISVLETPEKDSKYILIGLNDKLIAMLNHVYYFDIQENESEWVNEMLTAYNDPELDIVGVADTAELVDDTLRVSTGISFDIASSSDLQSLGYISGGGMYLSVGASIDELEKSGHVLVEPGVYYMLPSED